MLNTSLIFRLRRRLCLPSLWFLSNVGQSGEGEKENSSASIRNVCNHMRLKNSQTSLTNRGQMTISCKLIFFLASVGFLFYQRRIGGWELFWACGGGEGYTRDIFIFNWIFWDLKFDSQFSDHESRFFYLNEFPSPFSVSFSAAASSVIPLAPTTTFSDQLLLVFNYSVRVEAERAMSSYYDDSQQP